jgi:hypothetical protein
MGGPKWSIHGTPNMQVKATVLRVILTGLSGLRGCRVFGILRPCGFSIGCVSGF